MVKLGLHVLSAELTKQVIIYRAVAYQEQLAADEVKEELCSEHQKM